MKSTALFLALLFLFSFNANAGTCVAAVDCKNGNTASCSAYENGRFEGEDTVFYPKAVCGVSDTNTRFCRYDTIDAQKNVRQGLPTYVCCTASGEAISTRILTDCK